MENLNPYPAYQETEIPWLGQVPEHWETKRMKYLLREQDRRSEDGSEQLLRVSQYTGVTPRTREEGTRAESLVGYKVVKPNDLAINIMQAFIHLAILLNYHRK